jgi:sensor histidine kinase YesM
MQREYSTLLGQIRRSRYLLVWIGLYWLFVLLQLQRFNFVDSLISSLANIGPMIALSAIVQYLLIPRFLRRHRLWLFYILSFCLFAVIQILSVRADARLLESYKQRYPELFVRFSDDPASFYIFNQLKYTFLLMASYVVTVISHLLQERAEAEARVKEEHLQLELNYLKAQINPHFLFNSLNCIYSLAVSGSERTPESILQLSEMLRYVIDDCRNDQVQLGKELHYIHNYIDFQSIRMERRPNITVDHDVANPQMLIPPMILQPLVENCFKHSHIESDPNGYIALHIRQSGRHLAFTAENSVQPGHAAPSGRERTGIGVSNVRRRLEGLYGSGYRMEEFAEGNTYRVEMELELEASNRN